MPISVVAAQTQLKTSPGRIWSVVVLVAGAAGTVNDIASAGAGNPILPLPATLGYTFSPARPVNFAAGICVNPGAGQTAVVDWD
jgi:hypothetical protein